MNQFPIQRAAELKEKPDPKSLGFGKIFTDHMFVMNYNAGQGWHDGRIVPYGPLSLDPSTMVFHSQTRSTPLPCPWNNTP